MRKFIRMRKLGKILDRRIRELGSDPGNVEIFEGQCDVCGGKVFIIICEKGTVGSSESQCCLKVCDRFRRGRGLSGLELNELNQVEQA